MTEFPPPFTTSWLDPEVVKGWLHLNVGVDVDEDELVERCCAQTELYVQRCRPDCWDSTVEPPVYRPDAEVHQGAVMYAAREVRRRNSPAGIQSFGESGVSYVSKYDSDIERALRQGAWALPGVG